MIVMQRFSQYLFSTAFFIACIHFAFDTEAVEQKNGTSMQLPLWVESIGEPSKSQSDGTAPEEAIVPVVQSAVKSKNSSNSYSRKTDTTLPLSCGLNLFLSNKT